MVDDYDCEETRAKGRGKKIRRGKNGLKREGGVIPHFSECGSPTAAEYVGYYRISKG